MTTIVAAPDSLKGSLRAGEAAAALAEGVSRVAGVACRELPIGDGGEGTAEALRHALGGDWHEADAHDALGRPVRARVLLLPNGTAVVEAAEAIGLERLRADELDPLAASSRGLGELIRAAQRLRPQRILVGLGGSATVDGGAGLRLELGEPFSPSTPVVVACDVVNPLLGADGAARVFGPQKGATPAAVEELEQRLASMPALAPFASLPGAGAAGGLGAALAALGARLEPGADLILSLVGFDRHARGAGLVVTGEGKIDATTFSGKAVGAVIRRTRALGVPCAVFGGVVESRPDDAEVWPLSGDPGNARADLIGLGAELARRARGCG